MIVSRSKYQAAQAEIDRLKAEVSRLKEVRIPEQIKPKVEEVFRDDKGRAYYRYKNPAEMPYRLGVLSQIWLDWSSMNVTPELFDDFMEKIEEEANKGNMVKAFQLMGNMKDRRNILTQEDIVWQLAAITYIREDEAFDDFDEVTAREKIEYWKSRPKLRSFFLATCLSDLFNFGDKSQKAILLSFRAAQRKLAKLTPDTPERR